MTGQEAAASRQDRRLTARGAIAFAPSGPEFTAPTASAMEHHVGDEAVSARWAQVSNDVIARVVGLYQGRFAGVCQLAQCPEVPVQRSR